MSFSNPLNKLLSQPQDHAGLECSGAGRKRTRWIKATAWLMLGQLWCGTVMAAGPRPKNIIFLIGDGMGVAQIWAGYTANKGMLNLERCKHIGFSKTYSADDYITDSAAGATAFSIGQKTNNHVIGQDATGKSQPTILELADKQGLATGMVVTCSVTHATPASFIAHQPHRKMDEAIAADFLATDIDVLVGGGRQYFAQREDKRNLLTELTGNKYQLPTTLEQFEAVKDGKVVALVADKHLAKMSEGRGDFEPRAVRKTMELLSKNKKGFFLMVEGSQIDWGGHENDADYIAKEMQDFDKTIGVVLDWAKADGNTLVVITADHETGGFSIPAGNLQQGTFVGKFTTKDHTGVMVPVFAYGPGAEAFMGIYENNAIFGKFAEALSIKVPTK